MAPVNSLNPVTKKAAFAIREALQMGTKELMVTESIFHNILIGLRCCAPNVFFKTTELISKAARAKAKDN